MILRILNKIKSAPEDYISIAICIIGSLYVFFNPSHVEKEDLYTAKIVLESTPDYTERTADIKESVRFTDKGTQNSYIVHGCALNLNTRFALLSLLPGDTILIDLEKSDSLRHRLSSSTEVYGLVSPRDGFVFDYQSYNNCSENSWKGLFVLVGILIVVVFVPKFYRRLKSKKIGTDTN